MEPLRIGVLGAARITDLALAGPARTTGDRLVAVAARDRSRAGAFVLEGFHYLHHPVTRRLLELLDSGELGELRRVEVDAVIPAPADGDPRWSLELAGGALMDLGCYTLHAHRVLAPWAGGPPRLVS